MIDEVNIFRRKSNAQLDISTTELSFTNHYCVDLRMTKNWKQLAKVEFEVSSGNNFL